LLLAPEIDNESMPNVLFFACVGAGAALMGDMPCFRGGEKSLGGGAGLGSKKLPPLSELFCVVAVGEARLEKDEAVGKGGDCIPPKKFELICGFGAAACGCGCGFGADVVRGGDCMPPKLL
jgi:hypothetical protein